MSISRFCFGQVLNEINPPSFKRETGRRDRDNRDRKRSRDIRGKLTLRAGTEEFLEVMTPIGPPEAEFKEMFKGVEPEMT